MVAAEPLVIDTNVCIAANLKAGVSAECALACVRTLRSITREGRLALDDRDLIFDEYRVHLSFSGQPGTGDAFMKWVHDNRFNGDFCDRISVTPTDDGSFEEFPDAKGLASFDPNDRKFVAVAAAHPDSPEIVVAADRDWTNNRDALAAVGITVRFLCEPTAGGLGAAISAG